MDFVEQFVSDGRAVTRTWATEGDRAVFFIITNRPLIRGMKKSINRGRFFKSYPDLLIFSTRDLPPIDAGSSRTCHLLSSAWRPRDSLH